MLFGPVQFQARLNPEQPGLAALDSGARELSYGDIARQVDAAANALVQVGAGAAQRIGVHCCNKMLHVVIVLALSRVAEATLAFAADGEFAPGSIDLLVTDESNRDTSLKTVRIDAAALAASTGAQLNSAPLARAIKTKWAFSNRGPINGETFCARIAQRARAKGTGSTSRWLCAADIHSELGLSSVMESLWSGGLAVLSTGTFEDDVDALALYDADRLLVDSSTARDYLRIFDKTNKIAARVRTAIIAGGVPDEQTLLRIKKHVSPNTVVCLDLPETGAFAAGSLWQIGQPLRYWPLPGVELRILGSDDQPVGTGTSGALAIGSPLIDGASDRVRDGLFRSGLSGRVTRESALILSESAS